MTTTDAIAPLAPAHPTCDEGAQTDAVPFVFHRHRGPVTTATWIPGTQRILTAAYDGAIARFDLETDEVMLFGHHDHLANRVVVSDDGLRAVSVSSDYSAIVWDTRNGQRLQRLIGHSDDVEDFCFIGAHMGASVSRDRRILVWDLRSGAIVRAIEGHERDVLSICADERHLYTSGDDSTLRVWDIASGRQVRMWGPFETETDTCAIDPRHGRLVLGCDDGCIRVFAIHSGDLLAVIPAHSSGIKKVACSPVDGAILSAAYDQAIHLWSGSDFQHRLRLEARPRQWERSFNWSSDGTHVVAGTFDGTVLVWRADDGAFVTELGASQGTPGNDCFNDIAAVDDQSFATVNDAGHLRIGRFDTQGARWIAQAAPGNGRMLMNAVTSRNGGRRVVCGAHDQHLHVFERTGDADLRAATWHHLGEGPINCVRGTTPGHGEDALFVACYSGAIVRTAPDGTPLARFAHHANAVKALRLHPTQRIGVSCSADGVMTSWSFDGNLRHRFAGHTAIIDDLDLDPTGEFLASTGRDFHLLVYRLEDGVLLDAFDLGRRSPKGLCFLDRDTVVVSNYWGELLRIDLPSRTILRRAIAANGISAVARADAEGTHLLASSYDGACYRVRSDTFEVVGTLRAMQQRPAPARD